MKAIPLIIAALGLIAVAAMAWILFSGEGEKTPLPVLEEDLPAEEDPLIVPPDLFEDDPGLKEREALIGEATVPMEKETLLPTGDSPLFTASLRLRIAHRGDKRPVAAEGLNLAVTLNHMPLDRAPEATDRPGEYVLLNLLPGRYRVEAATGEWEKGAAECSLRSGESMNLDVLIDLPRTMEIRVMDAMTKNGVHNARIQSRGFIQGGLTDEKGFFTSSRKFSPDTELSVQITHPLYFATSLDFKALDAVAAGGPTHVELVPLSGNLTLQGSVKDEEGEILPRLSLFLSPVESEEWNDTATTYTNRNGDFRFDRLRPGTYRLGGTLRFLVSPYIPNPPLLFEDTVTLYPEANISDKVIVCAMPRRPLSGRILRADTLSPAAQAEVAYQKLSSGASNRFTATAPLDDPYHFVTAKTDVQGFFLTKKTFLPEEIYRLIVYGNIQVTTSDGLVSTCRSRKSPESLRRLQADILEGLPVTLWVVQQGDVTVSGRVLDASGVPIPQVRLTADSATDVAQGRVRAYTDDAGYFSVSSLFPGRWVVTALIPKGPTIKRSLMVPEKGGLPELLIRIEDSGRIEGEIVTDKSPSRWTVRVQGLGFETESQKIGSEFWYSFEHLPPGKARVILEVYEGRRYQESNLKVIEAWVNVKPGGAVQQNFTF